MTLIQVQALAEDFIRQIIGGLIDIPVTCDPVLTIAERWADWHDDPMNPYPDWVLDVDANSMDVLVRLEIPPHGYLFEFTYGAQPGDPINDRWSLRSSQFAGRVPASKVILDGLDHDLSYSIVNAKLRAP